MATGEAPSMAVANFLRFLAPEMVPSRMSNLAVGLWSDETIFVMFWVKPSCCVCLGAFRFVVLTCQGCVCGSGGQ